MYDSGREGKERKVIPQMLEFQQPFLFFAGTVNLKYNEYEKHEFLRQTEKCVGVNCGVHKMYVFFLNSLKCLTSPRVLP